MRKSVPQDSQIENKKATLIAEHRKLVSTWQTAQDVFTRLCRRLHTSLELDQCLSIFLEELHSVMAFNSFSYQHDQAHDSYVYTEGYGGVHHCEYNLSLQGEHLGYLSLNRRSRFAEEELVVLEEMIGILVFPLRNCWRHRQALDAAMTDSITLLGNKRALLAAMARSMTLAGRHREPLTLLLCDLDHFKTVNDNHGHVFGDEVLGVIATAIRQSIRSSDEAFRYGGEEYAVLLPHTSIEDAVLVAERIRIAVEQCQLSCEGSAVNITVSIGLAQYDRDRGTDLDALIDLADKALYKAKRDGRNQTRRAIVEKALA